MQEKTKVLSEYPFRSTEEEFWRAAFEILPRRKIWEMRQKIFDGNYRPATGRKSGFLGKNKHKRFFGSMGNTYKGSRNFRNCKGVQDSFFKKSSTRESSPDATHGSGKGTSNTNGDREHVEKGSRTANRASGSGVFKQYFLGWEKRWRKSICGELKILKRVHSISAFQNGRFVLPPRITAKGRLRLQFTN